MTEATIIKFLGLIYVVLGLGALFNASLYKLLIEEYVENARAMFCTSVAALTVGCLLVYYYGTWKLSWALIVPIVGVVAMLKGVTSLILPDFMAKLIRRCFQTETQLVFWVGILVVLGFAMLGIGYWVI